MPKPRYPALYEVNTRVYLTELAQKLGRPATLDDIPDSALDLFAEIGFDWIWFLGVWTTGLTGQQFSRANRESRKEFLRTLPDLREDDIVGSAFAITGYTTHPSLGGDAALERLRQRLHQRGLKLMLDFVPNHTALDHPWVQLHPEYYIEGSASDLSDKPQNYTRVRSANGQRILACGRDPYFPGWSDTLQLDYGKPEVQGAMIEELRKVAGLCDGARCDMAMLLLPEIFERTWGRSTDAFWPKATQQIREGHPEFCFMGEVYWDLELAVLGQGFDYVYDKRLYDRLVHGVARPIREHLHGLLEYQSKFVHFVENHDEPRAAAIFPVDVHKAAAVITFFSPGFRFFHQGQLEGFKKQISIHLARAPQEPVSKELQPFYRRLLAVLRQPQVRDGEWLMLERVPAWGENWTWDCFLAFAWRHGDENPLLVVINYAPHQSQCYVKLSSPEFSAEALRLTDLFGSAQYDRDGDEILSKGLYLDLRAWGFHVFSVCRM